MVQIQAKDLKIGQMVFWHGRPGVVSFKASNSQTIEITYCRGTVDSDTRQDTREIGFDQKLDVLDADFYHGDECIYRTFGAQEDKESAEKQREALVSQSLADKRAANKDDDKLRDLVDIFNPKKNLFLQEYLAQPMQAGESEFMKEMQKMMMRHKTNREPWDDKEIDR